MNNTTTTISVPVHGFYPSRPIQFGILLSLTILSIPCFTFVFYHTLCNRTFYRVLGNHVIILLLISNSIQTFTDVPMRLSYYFTGTIWPRTVHYCYFYYFIDFYLFTTCFLLITWASFERHIFIFHPQFFNRFSARVIGHYIPLTFCIVYPLIYYTIFIFFYPCKSYYDEETSLCVAACYLWVSTVMALYEQIAHGFALMFLIFMFNIMLFFRIIRQKRRMGRQMTWNKNRNMAIQLFSICFLLFLTNGGYFLVQLGQMLWNPKFGQEFLKWLFPLSMCMPPLTPLMCLHTIHNLTEKIKRFVYCGKHNAVAPLTATNAKHMTLTNIRRHY
ncbi:unnamed protein product [Adineta ricciae]|uniref:G-protein coupled receptors family 1 profile domain-containing protein n=1 Tax=Adineta ricciae TaxID=249248 RepID=A0A815DD66_ADIRI|nr:unnamed protein product [Adineta ricciae]CAF1296336.1 unnamed protein product [Adineta ricciae]